MFVEEFLRLVLLELMKGFLKFKKEKLIVKELKFVKLVRDMIFLLLLMGGYIFGFELVFDVDVVFFKKCFG